MHQHSHYRGPRRRRERKKSEKISEEIIAENLHNMRKEIPKSRNLRVPYRINPRRNIPKGILLRLIKIKDKEKLLKAKG